MKTPSFGKPLRDLLQSGQLPNNSVYLYIGDKAWDKGKSSSISRPTRTLILPPNESPLAYAWPVNGCDMLIIETSYISKHYLGDIAFALFEHKAEKITVIHPDFSSTLYKKDF